MALIVKGRSSLKGSTVIGNRPYAIDGYINPELVADFKRSYYRKSSAKTNFSGLINFSRASSATYRDRDGVIQTVGSGVARTGHHISNGYTFVNEGIFVESEARTNFLTYSTYEDASGSTPPTDWAIGFNTGTTTFSNSTIISGNKQVEQTGTSQRAYLYQSVGVTAGTTYTLSVYVHEVTSTNTTLIITGLSSGWTGSNRINDNQFSGPGIYSVTFTPAANDTIQIRIGLGCTSNTTGTVAHEAPQLEAGATVSSYIPTSASSVTRAADVLTIPSANLPYSSSSMSIQVDGVVNGENHVVTRWFADSSNYITQSINSSNYTFSQSNSGVIDEVTGGSFFSGTDVPYDIASRNGSSFINAAIDGVALTENSTPTALPDLSTSDLSLGYDYMGTIGQFRIWALDLGDIGISEATQPSLVPSLNLTFDGTRNSFIVEGWSE